MWLAAKSGLVNLLVCWPYPLSCNHYHRCMTCNTHYIIDLASLFVHITLLLLVSDVAFDLLQGQITS